MKTKAVRLHGADDIRIEEYELPAIKEDELLVKVITDGICMSTYKAVKQGINHKRVPKDIGENPVMLGHEMAGIIVEVGDKWKERYQVGERFALQPTLNYKGTLWAPGYSYPNYGGASTYCIIPHEAVELDCVLPYTGDGFFEASLGEPMSCVIGGFNANYHTNTKNYDHAMGTKVDGNLLILGGTGPMGIGAITYSLAMKNKPKRVVVTARNKEKIARIKSYITEESAKEKGIELIYMSTEDMPNQEESLLELTDGKGYDDVFLFIPVKEQAELGNKLLAHDGCMNIFAGPMDSGFMASVNLYNVHYERTHIMGASGGITIDTIEAIELMEKKAILPSAMVTHIGGLDCYPDTTMRLPDISGGKKMIYTQIDMPLVAIDELERLGQENSLYLELDQLCKKHNGLWNAEAEKVLLDYYHVER